MPKRKTTKTTTTCPSEHSILALDLGTIMGWALRRPPSQIKSGAIRFKPSIRYMQFGDFLEDNITTHIVYENVMQHVGTRAAHVYGGFLAYLETHIAKNEIIAMPVHVGTLKKWIAGRGNATKEEVIEAVRALGHSPVDDNEADAIALLMYAMRKGFD